MPSSDLLLVTDGEIPNPPVSEAMLAKLESLKENTGMEIHGLLIGKKESAGLDSLCTEVHDFLGDYDGLEGVLVNDKARGTASALSLLPSTRPCNNLLRTHRHPGRRRFGFALNAAARDRSNHAGGTLNSRGGGLNAKRRKKFDDDGDDKWDWGEDIEYSNNSRRYEPSKERRNEETTIGKSDFVDRVEKAVEQVRCATSKAIEQDTADDTGLDEVWGESQVISDTLAYVEENLVERDLEARLVVLGMVAREHVLFIGPPGTSKSEIGRRLSQLCGGPFFQRLFTRFTTPEEIFGPLSLRALENDEYVRCVEGFLPMATVAFLDEIFKANSAILNTLLTILNERKFDNGGTRYDCPLKCVIGASNELPESEELDALLDRFLLRSFVTSVSDEGLMKILSSKSLTVEPANADPDISDKLDEVVAKISKALDGISMGQNVCSLIRDMRTFLRETLGVYVSDRRLVKASRLLRVSAATNGRDRVDFVDCLLLQHVMWQIPEQQEAIREWLWDNINPDNEILDQAKFLLQGLASESLEVVKKVMGDITGESGARASDLEVISSIRRELESIQTLMQQHCDELERHRKLLNSLPGHLWIGQDEANAAKQYLLPLADATLIAADQTLKEIVNLKLAITSEVIDDDLRSSVIEVLTNNGNSNVSLEFTEDELQMSLKEAKRLYKGDELRRWKNARKIVLS